MKRSFLLAALLALLMPLGSRAQSSQVLGDWSDPDGSVINVGHCGAQVCLWIAYLTKSAGATTDIHNPDPRLRSRELCGLRIGSGFNLRDPAHATDGTLYDPKSGKTYHGMMTADAGKLHLRGYVGMPLFGASQTWTRASPPPQPCSNAGQ